MQTVQQINRLMSDMDRLSYYCMTLDPGLHLNGMLAIWEVNIQRFNKLLSELPENEKLPVEAWDKFQRMKQRHRALKEKINSRIAREAV